MPPAKPPTKTLTDLDKTEAVRQLGQLRATVGELEAQLRRRSVERAALAAFRDQVDALALLLTGRRDFFAGPAHEARFRSG